MPPTCPICHKEMTQENLDGPMTTVYEEFTCRQDEHFFISRIRDNEILKVKVRLGVGDDKLFLRIEYDKGISEVWGKSSSRSPVTVDETFVPDFSNVDRLRNKIKTYLIFS